MPKPTSYRRLAWGLVDCRLRWGLTLRGWAILVLVATLSGYLYIDNVFGFFAVTHRVHTRCLIVEGWVHDYAIQAAVAEFRDGHYEKIYTTGGPVQGTGKYTSDFNTAASVAAEKLIAAGVDPRFVQMVPSHVSDRERTYSSAVALRSWLVTKDVALKSANILTEDLHARRTWLLFQKAFGASATIGIISVPNSDYDPTEWWKYSEGIQEVFRETLAFVYVTIFFHPR